MYELNYSALSISMVYIWRRLLNLFLVSVYNLAITKPVGIVVARNSCSARHRKASPFCSVRWYRNEDLSEFFDMTAGTFCVVIW